MAIPPTVPAATKESHSLRCFQAEPAAAAGHYIDDQLGVLLSPIVSLELRPGNPHRHPVANVEHTE